jgi:hypothetical protein
MNRDPLVEKLLDRWGYDIVGDEVIREILWEGAQEIAREVELGEPLLGEHRCGVFEAQRRIRQIAMERWSKEPGWTGD